jgi:hypothetical protein
VLSGVVGLDVEEEEVVQVSDDAGVAGGRAEGEGVADDVPAERSERRR